MSGLPPVRLHDLRHLAATLALLAGHDIKVVQEKLGHSSRQITSDTYTSVLPEMMRAEAESVMAVVPRDIPFEERTALAIPESAWLNGVAVFFAHGARQSGDTWAVGAQPQPGADVLGVIGLAGRGQDDAANAAVRWIRDHSTANELELVRVENVNDQYPEGTRTHKSDASHLRRCQNNGHSHPFPSGCIPPRSRWDGDRLGVRHTTSSPPRGLSEPSREAEETPAAAVRLLLPGDRRHHLLGVFMRLRQLVLESYDRIVGLELDRIAVDGSITKAPGGGEIAGR